MVGAESGITQYEVSHVSYHVPLYVLAQQKEKGVLCHHVRVSAGGRNMTQELLCSDDSIDWGKHAGVR